MRKSPTSAALTVAVLVLAACGPGTSPIGSSQSPSVTVMPTAWDLVAIGDSMVEGYGVAPDEGYVQVYAARLGEELGVTVDVQTYSFDEIADGIQQLASDESLRLDLAKAEIVLLFFGFHNIGNAILGSECTGDWPALEPCLRAATGPMPDAFDAYFARLRTLAPDRIPVLHGYDGGLPPLAVDEYQTQPYWPEMRRILVDDWRPGLYAAAEAHDVTVIGWYEALNGPDGEALHPEFLQADRAHFNAAGHRFLAELHLAQDGLGNE